MSIVKRVVIANQIEPGSFSFKAGRLASTELEVTYYDQSMVPLSIDVAGQLRLVGRSNLIERSYSLPATDIANGKAMTIIPAGDLVDASGYQALLYGSLDGRAALLARGVVYPDNVAAIPTELPVDVIDVITLHLDRAFDEPSTFTVTLWDDTGKTDPFDLATGSVAAAIYDAPNQIKLTDFSVTQVAANQVELSLTPAQVAALPDTCWWSLVIFNSLGMTTIAQGDVLVQGVPPIVFVPFSAAFDYRKPDVGDPSSGQIVHENFVRNHLKISMADNATQDVSIIAAMEIGDTISDGTTTWTLTAVPFQAGTWFDIDITPYDQLATEGVKTFTFDRP
jgi:hypothetical protein